MRAKKKKKEDHIKRDGFTCCSTGGKNHKNYVNTIYTLNIDFISDEDVGAGFMTGFQVYDSDGLVYRGKNTQEFYDFLNCLKLKYNLESYNKFSKDSVIIYIDKVLKAYGFFYNHVTSSFMPFNVEIDDFFEIRSYQTWQKDLDNAEAAAKVIQKIVDKVFIPEKHFYLTPNSRTRHHIKAAAKKENCDIATDLYPKNAREYRRLREALYGGICYCPLPGVIKEKKILGLDIKSAYIYSLLTQRFPMSQARKASTDTWEFYMDSPYESSLGVYEITYTTTSNIIHCFKEWTDVKATNLVSGKDVTVILTLDDVDLKTLLTLPRVMVSKVSCKYLEVYDNDYLPHYMVDILVNEYLKKSSIDKDKDLELYSMQKVVLNGIYGNTIKNEGLDYYSSLKSKAAMAPQWGIWTTSYTKKHLLSLALQIEGWLYSDTDSIYCYDTEDNRNKLDEFNKDVNKVMAKFCERTGYIHKELLELGTFELEHEIKKFKALKQKEYLFTIEVENTINTDDGKTIIIKEDKIIVKAAGCNKEEMKLDDRLYKCKMLPVGTKRFPDTNKKPAKTTIDGITYYSESSYFERVFSGRDALAYMIFSQMLEDEVYGDI